MTFSMVVSVGTYHFGFDRLMAWTQSWLELHPEAVATVQHGTSRPVPGAENREIIPHPELLDLYRNASVIVLQGGAGGVMDARELGIQPIVVPRIPVDDEVVDEHQIVFADGCATSASCTWRSPRPSCTACSTRRWRRPSRSVPSTGTRHLVRPRRPRPWTR